MARWRDSRGRFSPTTSPSSSGAPTCARRDAGAGCGSHWPLCNGVVIQPLAIGGDAGRVLAPADERPRAARVVGLWPAGRGALTARGDPARRAAAASVFFMLTEAALGAGLVLFRLVADNATMARALFMAAHLANTFILLKALTLTAWWLSGGGVPSLRDRGRLAGGWALSAGLFLIASISGAVAALGETPVSIRVAGRGLRADLSTISRVDPAENAASGACGLGGRGRDADGAAAGRTADTTGQRLARTVVTIAGLQLIAGLTNVLLLAPIWMQLTHLLLADAVGSHWCSSARRLSQRDTWPPQIEFKLPRQ